MDGSSIESYIDVAAPGVDIWSTVPTTNEPLGYAYLSGNSQSAPQVSGLAAWLLGVNPRLYNDDIEQLIRLSADDVNRNTSPGFDDSLGMGRINAHRALQLLQFPHALYQETAAGGTAVDSTIQYTLKFFVPPDTLFPAGNYKVRRFKVHKSVTFPVTFDSIPHVWGRGAEDATTGYSPDVYQGSVAMNWNMGWCDTVGGTVTSSGCTLRTFVYEVSRLTGQFIGWWPVRYDGVVFAYTVLGTAPLTDAGTDPAGTSTLVPSLSSQNPLRRGANIAFAIPQAGLVRIDVFDVAGRRIRVLQEGELPQGRHELLRCMPTDTSRCIEDGTECGFLGG